MRPKLSRISFIRGQSCRVSTRFNVKRFSLNNKSKEKEKSSKINGLEDGLQAAKVEHGEISAAMERLNKELEESRSSQAQSESRVGELEGKLEKFTQELEEGNQQRNQAREIISSMLHLLDDLNRQPNSAD